MRAATYRMADGISVEHTPTKLKLPLAFRLDTLVRMSRGPALGEIYRPLAVVSWKRGK